MPNLNYFTLHDNTASATALKVVPVGVFRSRNSCCYSTEILQNPQNSTKQGGPGAQESATAPSAEAHGLSRSSSAHACIQTPKISFALLLLERKPIGVIIFAVNAEYSFFFLSLYLLLPGVPVGSRREAQVIDDFSTIGF